MLYDRWMATAKRHGGRLAVREACGREWSFEDLALAGERAPAPQGPVVTAGTGIRLLVDVLRAWRAGVPVIPTDSAAPPAGQLQGLPDWVAHAKTTSGSTGTPKLVLFRAAPIAADAEAIVSTMGLDPDLPNVGVVSMAHSYGFSNLVTPLLLCGIPLLMAESPLPGSVRAVLAAAGRAVLPAVPAMWKSWHASGFLRQDQIALAISAGAPLPVDLERRVFADTGIKIHNFYGASECGAIAFDRDPAPRGPDDESVGAPVEGVRLSVGADGCLEIRGPAVGDTYWPRADGRLADGVFRTTDRATIGPGHEVTLLGRAGDTMNVAGRKVEPGTVEAVIDAHPGVATCVVFGLPSRDPGRSNLIVACLRLRDSSDLESVRQRCAARLPPWQVPRRWVLVPDLRPDDRGKVSRRFWREKLLASGAEAEDP
ncbi:hypothetical protein BH23VER1_BH23VER1_16610 [soil metagenome]